MSNPIAKPSDRANLLAGLNLTPKTASSLPIPPPRKKRTRRFLPGESRATCGLSGFRELNVRSYLRSIYSNAEPRNLTPPQFLDNTGGITSERKHSSSSQSREWTFLGSDPHFPATWKKIKSALDIECASERYREKFFLSLLCASYHTWTIGAWSWREDQSTPLHTSL